VSTQILVVDVPKNEWLTANQPLIDGLRDAGILAEDHWKLVIGPDHRHGEPLPSLKTGWHRIVLTITPEGSTQP